MRTVVGATAALCVAAVLAGIVMLVTSGEREPRWWAGWVLVALALVVAVGCLRHGARHEHERGRGPAIAAVILALPAFILGTHAAVTRCAPGALLCNDLGFEEDR